MEGFDWKGGRMEVYPSLQSSNLPISKTHAFSSSQHHPALRLWAFSQARQKQPTTPKPDRLRQLPQRVLYQCLGPLSGTRF